MSFRSSMPVFEREEGSWLFNQDFWLGMSPLQKEAWLEYREGVTMQYEDILFIRELERTAMGQQDVVEMSRYHWDDMGPEEKLELSEYQHAWRVLGGGGRIAARLEVTDAPRTPLKRFMHNRRTNVRRDVDNSDDVVWARRSGKRQAGVHAVTRDPRYIILRNLSAENDLPPLPDPDDRTIGKKDWEAWMQRWRRQLRQLYDLGDI